jgi:hypothetical protein
MPSKDLYHYGAYSETLRALKMRQIILRTRFCIQTLKQAGWKLGNRDQFGLQETVDSEQIKQSSGIVRYDT